MIYPLKFRFLLSLAILLFFGSQAVAQSSDCEEIQVTAKVVHTTEGNANGEIHLTFAKSDSEFLVHWVKTNKEYELNTKPDIFNLTKGTFTIMVTGKDEKQRYCPKHLKVKVQ